MNSGDVIPLYSKLGFTLSAPLLMDIEAASSILFLWPGCRDALHVLSSVVEMGR